MVAVVTGATCAGGAPGGCGWSHNCCTTVLSPASCRSHQRLAQVVVVVIVLAPSEVGEARWQAHVTNTFPDDLSNVAEEGISKFRRRVGEQVNLLTATCRLIPQVDQFPREIRTQTVPHLRHLRVADLPNLHLRHGNQHLIPDYLHLRLVRHLRGGPLKQQNTAYQLMTHFTFNKPTKKNTRMHLPCKIHFNLFHPIFSPPPIFYSVRHHPAPLFIHYSHADSIHHQHKKSGANQPHNRERK